MKTALFIILPFPSHYNACLGAIQAKQNDGYEVFVTTTTGVHDYVNKLGLKTVNFSYMLETDIVDFKSWLAILIQSSLNKRFVRNRLKYFLKIIKDIFTIVDQIKPSDVYIDSTLNYYGRILENKIENIYFLNTRISSRKSYKVRPYISDITGSDSFKELLLCELSWVYIFIKKEYKSSLNKIAFLFRDDDSIIEKILNKKFAFKKRNLERLNVGYNIDNKFTEYVLSPIKFEYPWYKSNKQEKYVFFASSSSKKKLEIELYDWLNNSNCNDILIYCSLGTLSDGINAKVSIKFLTDVIEACGEMLNVRLIMSAGSIINKLSFVESRRLLVKSFLPQIEVIGYADLVITHAGMNTVKECLLLAKPMLAYPVNYRVEQPGNAARIDYHRIGLKGNIYRSTKNQIKANILEIINNKVYKENIQEMSKLVHEESTSSSRI